MDGIVIVNVDVNVKEKIHLQEKTDVLEYVEIK